MYRLTPVSLRQTGLAVYSAISSHHPIKKSVALECWANGLGGKWSSLVAEANQCGAIEVTPSITRLVDALEGRRKSITPEIAGEILERAAKAAGKKDVTERAPSGVRDLARRKLAAYAIRLLEDQGSFSWDPILQPELPPGQLVAGFVDGIHQVIVKWRDIGFNELSCEVVIPSREINLAQIGQDHFFQKEDEMAELRFWIERQDGPFVQYMHNSSLYLPERGKPLVNLLLLPEKQQRVYRFADRIWM